MKVQSERKNCTNSMLVLQRSVALPEYRELIINAFCDLMMNVAAVEHDNEYDAYVGHANACIALASGLRGVEDEDHSVHPRCTWSPENAIYMMRDLFRYRNETIGSGEFPEDQMFNILKILVASEKGRKE